MLNEQLQSGIDGQVRIFTSSNDVSHLTEEEFTAIYVAARGSADRGLDVLESALRKLANVCR